METWIYGLNPINNEKIDSKEDFQVLTQSIRLSRNSQHGLVATIKYIPLFNDPLYKVQ